MNPQQITDLIRRRRSIFPPTYTDKPIPKAIIDEVLENANWAPNHKLTEPWRFKVLRGDALARLSDWLVSTYLANTPKEMISESKLKKLQNNPIKAQCIIAICMNRDIKERLPEWEEIAAVACAVQNMWLTTTAHNIGAYWSSPGLIEKIGDFLKLEENERCLGFFYMGYHNVPEIPGKRAPIEEKVEWID